MKVKELIATLNQCDPDALVVMSKDAEGNAYHKLDGVEVAMRYADGEIGLAELTEADIEAGFSEEDVMTHGQACVVFWPDH